MPRWRPSTSASISPPPELSSTPPQVFLPPGSRCFCFDIFSLTESFLVKKIVDQLIMVTKSIISMGCIGGLFPGSLPHGQMGSSLDKTASSHDRSKDDWALLDSVDLDRIMDPFHNLIDGRGIFQSSCC